MKFDLYDYIDDLMYANHCIKILIGIVEDNVYNLITYNSRCNKDNPENRESVNGIIEKFNILLKALSNETGEQDKNLGVLWKDYLAKKAVSDESPEEKIESVGEYETLAVDIKTYEV